MPKNSPWMVTYNLEFVWILCIYFFHMDTDRYRHSLRLQHTQDCKRICDHQRCSRRMNLPNSCQCQWHIHQYLKWKSKYVETIQLAGCGAQITVHFPQYRVHEWYIRELKQDLIDSIAIARLIILTSYGLNVDVSIPQGKKDWFDCSAVLLLPVNHTRKAYYIVTKLTNTVESISGVSSVTVTGVRTYCVCAHRIKGACGGVHRAFIIVWLTNTVINVQVEFLSWIT